MTINCHSLFSFYEFILKFLNSFLYVRTLVNQS
nr:MAG TPA: hypothetical protein [Ackermannviridae sp.]